MDSGKTNQMEEWLNLSCIAGIFIQSLLVILAHLNLLINLFQDL